MNAADVAEFAINVVERGPSVHEIENVCSSAACLAFSAAKMKDRVRPKG